MRPERRHVSNFDALAAADEDDDDEDAAASEEYSDNGIKCDQFMIPPIIIWMWTLYPDVFCPEKKRTFRPQNGQVARGKTVMIAGHGAFGVENVRNAEVQTTERTGFSSIFWWEQQGSLVKGKSNPIYRWWFQTFFMFTPTWGNDPILANILRWVETTN